MSDHAEILGRVIPAVAESLSVDPDEVHSSQTYFGDLEGESIGWLDLSFRLDKEFRVRIPGVSNFAAVETDEDGCFTAAGLIALRTFMPAPLIDRLVERVPRPAAKDLLDAITVDDIAGMVEMAIASKNAIAST